MRSYLARETGSRSNPLFRFFSLDISILRSLAALEMVLRSEGKEEDWQESEHVTFSGWLMGRWNGDPQTQQSGMGLVD